MRYSFIIFLSFFSVFASGQFIKDIHGRPYLTTGYEQYEGSPFHFANWVKADVVMSSGTSYNSMLINIDEYKNAPVFFREGHIYTFTEDVVEITVNNDFGKQTFKRGRLINPSMPDVYFEVVNTAPMIVKSNTRDLVEVPTYGEAHKHYRFDESKGYYAIINGAAQKLSLNKSNAEKVFPDKWKVISDYVSANRMSMKSEEDWLAVIRYYQTL